jgi:hypothetical protein
MPNIAENYQRINATWGVDIPPLTELEAVRAARKLFRFTMRRTFNGKVFVTSGRRYTWIRRGNIYVNPEKGWKELVHMISHWCCHRMRPEAKNHSKVHARFEQRMVKEVLKRGWLQGTLKTEPVVINSLDVKMARLDKREREWLRRLRRAQTALKSIKRSKTATLAYHKRKTLDHGRANGTLQVVNRGDDSNGLPSIREE